MLRKFFLFIPVLLFLHGCGTTVPDDPSLWNIAEGNLPPTNISVNIPGLGPCTDNPDRTLHLNSHQPTTVLVHGCFASSGRFRALAEVFAFHGQQTVCFSYNDRDSMMQSSAEMISSLRQLGSRMDNRAFTVIGHSQGGLISRKALIRERKKQLDLDSSEIRLITISSPFSGIRAANHCGSPTAKILSLGLVIPVCYAISGDKWYEITSASDFIQSPGSLVTQVDSYLKIVTDERNTCRRYNEEGHCIEDDYVFSLGEQYFPPVDNDDRVTNIQLHAGHVEIVGDRHVAPAKLIRLLQNQGVMNKTPSAQQKRFQHLLGKLYDLH